MGTHQAAELRLDGCEAAGLDLDQQIVSNDIDDKPADRDFESISLPCVPLLEGCVEGFLIQQTDSWHLNPNPTPWTGRYGNHPAAGYRISCPRASSHSV